MRALSHALSVADVSSWMSSWVLEFVRHVGGDSDKGPESHSLSRLVKRRGPGVGGVSYTGVPK